MENACFSSLDASFFLHALSARASFGAAPVAFARYQVSSAVLRCVLCNASERRSYTRATMSMRPACHVSSEAGFCESRSRGSWVRLYCQGSLASKERSLHTGKTACSRRARSVACALSGVQSAEWCGQRHKTTSPDPQERSFASRLDKTSHQNRFCSQCGRRKFWPLTAYQTRETPPQQSSDHCATALNRCGCVEAKPRRIQSLCCSRRSTLLR